MKLRLSSRQSALAQAQAYQVGAELSKKNPHLEIEFLFRESLGDKNLKDPLWKMPERGVFTEDFFQDLVENKTDLVVHSWKDLPTEVREQTMIAATLPRADQRDLLLFKKSSLKKAEVKIFSSSPRRAHNIKPFLSWALPWTISSLEFQSVRGNIPTRIQKLLEDSETDGLILAKAAIDRLMADTHFPETVQFLKKALRQLDWMVLPLTENPNAAAQGALAIEISNKRPEISNLMMSINCEASYLSAQRERDILKEFGGGCHLALGMSVLERSYGRIEIVRGLTPKGEIISSKKFYPSKKRPADLKIGRIEFSSNRIQKNVSFEGFNALYISKADAATADMKADCIWAAGIQTWKKLASMGIWVHGSSEGLGESEDPRVQSLCLTELKWARVTHDLAMESGDRKSLGAYHLELELKTSELDSSINAYQWKSGSEFLLAIQRFPELKNRFHICGPGRTYDTIRQQLGSDQNIFVELNDGFITVI